MTVQMEWQIVVGVVSGIVWLIRLEGRVNQHEREVTRQFDVSNRDRADLRDDIKYIRDRIDAIATHVATHSRTTLRDG